MSLTNNFVPSTSESTAHVPPIVSWIVTARCNLRCYHCYLDCRAHLQQELTREQRLTAVAQFAEAGVEAVFFSGGEVLLVPYVFKLVSFAREWGMSTWLCTNGELVDEAMAQRIADSGIAGVSVSLDGASAGAHDGLRGATGAFDKALRAIRHLRDAQVEVVVDFTLTLLNRDEAPGVLALARDLGCARLLFRRFRPLGRGHDNASRLQLQLQDHLEAAKGALEASTGLSVPLSYEDPALASHFRHLNGSASESVYSNVGCQAGVVWVGVQPNGDVTPCPLLRVPIGNLTREGFRESIVQSPVMKRLLDRSRRGGACGACAERWYCGGCRAHAYVATGDVFGADPFCVRLLEPPT